MQVVAMWRACPWGTNLATPQRTLGSGHSSSGLVGPLPRCWNVRAHDSVQQRVESDIDLGKQAVRMKHNENFGTFRDWLTLKSFTNQLD